MKLIVQIPCLNEAETLPRTLADLPRAVPGISAIEVLVVDDGSTDGTAEVARRLGVQHVLRFRRNRGLARAFAAGLEYAVAHGADVVVNTDADNQYAGEDIARLVAPIVDGTADLVVGERPMQEFSASKRMLQRLGTAVVRVLSGTRVRDAASGFRAITADAAASLKVFNGFSYTVETLIQAGLAGWAIESVPIRTNPTTRPSRLFRSNLGYIWRQALTMVRIVMTYRPFEFFAAPGALLFLGGFGLGLRFLWFYLTDGGRGHVQSVILASLAMGLGAGLVLVGLVADLVSVNRKLLQAVDARTLELSRRLDRRPGPVAAPGPDRVSGRAGEGR